MFLQCIIVSLYITFKGTECRCMPLMVDGATVLSFERAYFNGDSIPTCCHRCSIIGFEIILCIDP